MAAYQSNREDANCAAIESSPVAQALHGFLGSREDGRFHGSTLKLLGALRIFLETHAFAGAHHELQLLLKHPKFPKSANQLSAEIARIEPNLKKLGIAVERGRTHAGRYLILDRRDEETMRDDGSKMIVMDQVAVEVGL